MNFACMKLLHKSGVNGVILSIMIFNWHLVLSDRTNKKI